MDHRHGTDPTPQGRTPHSVRRAESNPLAGTAAEPYATSVPGPDVRKDGVYFLGYKRDGAYQPEEAKET